MKTVTIRQSFDDRAVGPLVAVAALREMPERGGHFLQLTRFRFQKSDMFEGYTLHVRACPLPIPP